MQIIKCEGIGREQARDKMIQGMRGIIRAGNNPFRVSPQMTVKATPIMGDEGNTLFLVQLLRAGVVVACATTTTKDV